MKGVRYWSAHNDAIYFKVKPGDRLMRDGRQVQVDSAEIKVCDGRLVLDLRYSHFRSDREPGQVIFHIAPMGHVKVDDGIVRVAV